MTETSVGDHGVERAVFLDRDGTIVEDVNYLADPEELRLLDGAAEALRRLQDAGFLLLVTTNQSGVARGYLSEDKLCHIHEVLRDMLREHGVRLDDCYYCPHLPDGPVEHYARRCECRKPKPGLLEAAAREHGVQVGRSWVVGDSERDVEAGRRAGCRTILLSGEQHPETHAEAVVPDLSAAVDIILSEE